MATQTKGQGTARSPRLRGKSGTRLQGYLKRAKKGRSLWTDPFPSFLLKETDQQSLRLYQAEELCRAAARPIRGAEAVGFRMVSPRAIQAALGLEMHSRTTEP